MQPGGPSKLRGKDPGPRSFWPSLFFCSLHSGPKTYQSFRNIFSITTLLIKQLGLIKKLRNSKLRGKDPGPRSFWPSLFFCTLHSGPKTCQLFKNIFSITGPTGIHYSLLFLMIRVDQEVTSFKNRRKDPGPRSFWPSLFFSNLHSGQKTY